jgi:hypothetical protein
LQLLPARSIRALGGYSYLQGDDFMPKEGFLKSFKNIGAWFKHKMALLTFYEILSLSISFLGVLSLALIFKQTYQTSASMQASAYQSIAANTLELDKILIEKPELRPYFYSGVDINENDKNYELVMAIAEFQLDFFDATLTQFEVMPSDTQLDKEAWNKYFSDSFAKSPGLCKRINSNRDWYRDNLVGIASRSCAHSDTK